MIEELKENIIMETMFDRIEQFGLIPVIKIQNIEDAIPLCNALQEGGLPVAEITFRTSAAEEAIKMVKSTFPEILLGAGTVINIEQAERAIEAGAQFIVSPGCNPKIIEYCIQNNIPIIPGCSNPTDIEIALSFGLSVIKFFPAEACGGITMIKALAAPYRNIKFIPTGGINEKNLNDYLSFPAVLACGGSFMVKDEWIKAKNFEKVKNTTQEAVKIMLGFDLGHVGIHCKDSETAKLTAENLVQILGQDLKEGISSIFVGNTFEICKTYLYNTTGHIAIKTNNIVRAKAYLSAKGIEFNEDSAKYKNDKLIAVYLKNSIGGMAIHLLQIFSFTPKCYKFRTITTRKGVFFHIFIWNRNAYFFLIYPLISHAFFIENQ